MISNLAKSIAHFFVVQKIVEEPREVIYAYGLELLISDVLNTLIVLLIAVFTHTLPAVLVFVAVFVGLRQFVGGYHANSHLSCMLTLIVVMMLFCFGVCNISKRLALVFGICFIVISLPIIFCIAPVSHPNKPMSDEKHDKLKKCSRILSFAIFVAVILMLILGYQKIGLYVSCGMLLTSVMAVLGRYSNRG